jgi:sugar/nucleoside kinase (ribokinase family)
MRWAAQGGHNMNNSFRVGSTGILVADLFCGPLDRLPHEGELLAIDALPVTVGGCAANVGVALARQGVEADVVGSIGRDWAGEVVVSLLEASGVSCARIVYHDALPTSQTVALLVKGQDRRFLHLFGANAALTVAHMDRDWLRTLDVFYLGGLYVLPGIDMDAFADMLRFCRAEGVTTVVDVITPQSVSDFGGLAKILPHVDYFIPNEDEAARITGRANVREQIAALQGWGAHTLVITQGSKGLTAAQGDKIWRAQPFAVEAVDPSGGGDAFAAGLIYGIGNGWALPEMLRYASVLGASATLAVGTTTSVFTRAQAEAYLREHEFGLEEG